MSNFIGRAIDWLKIPDGREEGLDETRDMLMIFGPVVGLVCAAMAFGAYTRSAIESRSVVAHPQNWVVCNFQREDLGHILISLPDVPEAARPIIQRAIETGVCRPLAA